MHTKRMTSAALIFAIALVLLATRPAHSGQFPGGATEALIDRYALILRDTDPGLIEKAVPRTDKAEAQIIGSTALVDDVHFTSNGTPFRLVALRQARPAAQDIIVVCLGARFVDSCGRLRGGQRAFFTTDLLVIDSGTYAGFPLIFVKRQQV